MSLYEQSNFFDKEMVTISDIISVTCAYQSLILIVGFMSILSWLIMTLSVEELNSFMIKDKYGIFFYAIETHSLPKASYYLVFLFRRFFISIVLVFLHKVPLI